MADQFDLVSNTFIAKEQSFAIIEVGDSKQPDAFYPQVKLMRWDNEVNFSVRLVSDETDPVTSLVADNIQWVGKALDANFYQIGEGKEGDGFEFEIILKEPPKLNVISMTIQTKGLEFLYQPELTKEEIDQGAVRPDNVVGSYAVYHATQAGDYSRMGGKNYLAGKFCHIYRPKMVDALGTWVWGDLNIDTKAGLLTVTIDQKFLDNAVYPVRHAAGLTFGWESYGATVGYIGNSYVEYFKLTSAPALDGTLTEVRVYTKIYDGTPQISIGFYGNSSGHPAARLVSTETGGFPAVDYDWILTSLTYSIIAATQYFVGLHVASPNSFYIKYDSVTSGDRHYKADTNMTWPDPASYSGSDNRRPGVYATYTAGGGDITGTINSILSNLISNNSGKVLINSQINSQLPLLVADLVSNLLINGFIQKDLVKVISMITGNTEGEIIGIVEGIVGSGIGGAEVNRLKRGCDLYNWDLK